MPIFRINDKIYYFSHIPKCGGSSIEDYIGKVVEKKVAFLNSGEYGAVFRNSSPQHILGYEAAKLFKPDFFDGYFAVVRNPYARFVSAFVYQKFITKKIPVELTLNQFAIKLKENEHNLRGKYDNHFVQQSSFFYPGAKYRIFKMENGLNDVKNYIDKINNSRNQLTSMPHSNKQSEKNKYGAGELDEKTRKIIFDLYNLVCCLKI